MSQLAGRVAVVTGASKGIGAQIARAFAAEGAAVVVNYASARADAEAVVGEIAAAGGRAIAIRADIGKAEEVAALFAETRRAFDRLDVLVNNAGIYKFGPIEAVTEEDLRRQVDTNLIGPILAIREAVRLFGEGGGSIINIGTTAVAHPPRYSMVYAASKAGLDAISLALATELGPRKIRVNTLHPGAVDTPGTRALGVVGSDIAKQVIARTALGRLGQPDDIARVAVFLASDAAAWVTGAALTASGGFTGS